MERGKKDTKERRTSPGESTAGTGAGGEGGWSSHQGLGEGGERREEGERAMLQRKGRGQAVIMELEYAVTASFATPRK